MAAAGCGKTELLGRIVADSTSGRQLVLTHTHAGVAAMRQRLNAMNVPSTKYCIGTIAGWCLRIGASYSVVSGLRADAESDPDWDSAYPGAERLLGTRLGKRILAESYDGVLVDEYQDCSIAQHHVFEAMARIIPCRGVGDPLQSVFGFRNDPIVPWELVQDNFQVVNELRHPWRWQRSGRNAALGNWLTDARRQLESKQRLRVDAGAPVKWIQSGGDHSADWADACRDLGALDGSVVAILNWPAQCVDLARRLGGRWPIVERFDDPEMLELATGLASASGCEAVDLLFHFIAPRMTGIGTDLKRMVDAISSHRSTRRFSTYLDHCKRLEDVASAPSAESILAALDGFLGERRWWLYRSESVYQLRSALRECLGRPMADLPGAVSAARARARRRGRRSSRRTIGTPLLVKGLEFDHAAVMWEPAHFTIEGLYVAITRASMSLTIVSRARDLVPGGP